MRTKTLTVIAPNFAGHAYWQDVWRYRELVYFLAWRDLLVRYKQTVVGIAWTLMKPLAMLIAYTFVFGFVAKLPSTDVPYLLVVMTGLLPWLLFASSIGVISESLVANAHLVSKVSFPRIIIPVSAIAVCVVDHLISLLLMAPFLAWHGIVPGWQLLLLPFVILLASVTAFGVGFVAAALNVYFRDFRQIIPLALQIGVFVSPVGYVTGLVPPNWQPLYALNPLVGVIDAFRWCVLGKAEMIFAPSVLIALAFASITLICGIRLFRRLEGNFADAV